MTCSQLNCLIQLKRLSEGSDSAASVALSRSLGLSKPSVHRLLEGLRQMGLVEKEFYGQARLSDEGVKMADKMIEKAERLSGLLAGRVVKPEKAYYAALLMLSSLEEEDFGAW